MAAFYQATQIFTLNENHRRQSEQKAGDLWRDVVYERLKARAMRPLGDEEATYLARVREHELQLERAMQVLERSGL